MQHMQEDEFDKIPQTCKPEDCQHEVVKLYYKSTHSDYGCVRCKMKSLILEDFRKDSRRL